ncbi:MAG: hypothetical protein V7754_23435, partial [Halioglobus sp.]
SGTQANLRSVLPLPDGRVLAGGLGGIVLELRDGQWQSIVTDTGCPIVSMAALEDDSVIAVGGEYNIETNQFIGRMFLYSEGKWSAIEIENPLPRLRRVRKEGDSLLITGDGGTALRWTTSGLKPLVTRLRYDLHDVISFAEGQALICGDDGTVLLEAARSETTEAVTVEQRSHWKKISNDETNKTLRTIWAIDDTHVIAAGDSGTVIHYRDEQVTVHQTPGKQRIHALWGSSPRNIYA